MIYSCVIFYNDAELLEDCLKSLEGTTVIAVDGPFKDFPHDSAVSTDGSVEIAKKYADIYIEGQVWETQVDKRNAYVDLIPEGSSFLVIDADERLVGEPKDGNWQVKIDAVGGINYWWPRIFTKTKGFKYYKTHMTFADDNGIIKPKEFPKLDITIKHLIEARTQDRLAEKEVYRKIHNARELKDRERYS